MDRALLVAGAADWHQDALLAWAARSLPGTSTWQGASLDEALRRAASLEASRVVLYDRTRGALASGAYVARVQTALSRLPSHLVIVQPPLLRSQHAGFGEFLAADVFALSRSLLHRWFRPRVITYYTYALIYALLSAAQADGMEALEHLRRHPDEWRQWVTGISRTMPIIPALRH